MIDKQELIEALKQLEPKEIVQQPEIAFLDPLDEPGVSTQPIPPDEIEQQALTIDQDETNISAPPIPPDEINQQALAELQEKIRQQNQTIERQNQIIKNLTAQNKSLTPNAIISTVMNTQQELIKSLLQEQRQFYLNTQKKKLSGMYADESDPDEPGIIPQINKFLATPGTQQALIELAGMIFNKKPANTLEVIP